MRALLIALLASCVVEAPPVDVVLVGDVTPEVRTAALVWFDVGAALRESSELPACVDRERAACAVTIEVVRDVELFTSSGQLSMANRSTRTVYLSPELLERQDLLPRTAHELGHVILDVADLVGERRGVMSPGGGTVVTTDDLEIACRRVGLGCP